VGPYRADYFLYFEDTEWCARARGRGWRCQYHGEVLSSHAISVSSGQRGSLGLSENTAYYLARNPLRFALETPSVTLRANRLLGILTIWLGYNILRIVASRRWSVATAYLEGLRDGFMGRMGPRGSRSPSRRR
jgi:GT2 family glycosyltransferase